MGKGTRHRSLPLTHAKKVLCCCNWLAVTRLPCIAGVGLQRQHAACRISTPDVVVARALNSSTTRSNSAGPQSAMADSNTAIPQQKRGPMASHVGHMYKAYSSACYTAAFSCSSASLSILRAVLWFFVPLPIPSCYPLNRLRVWYSAHNQINKIVIALTAIKTTAPNPQTPPLPLFKVAGRQTQNNNKLIFSPSCSPNDFESNRSTIISRPQNKTTDVYITAKTFTMAAVQLNFSLRTSSHCKTVHLLGSWDNYQGQLPLSKDPSKSGAWKGTFRFQGSTLKQGSRYWYYVCHSRVVRVRGKGQVC